ncbi:leader peptidase (prepilin peptidase) / N-methyltransferase [Paramicrobacterium humi]|uniref:Prepilin leader peptidase/N-methyltransferase n=1 Tax=Paramicrobacterium humi TaxID=640635 RepID=A0A1H4J3C3_9MICO|nr:A24 family peptidase [Microbacterium humi]SEB40810.1 leader peptidase (prepilin peptidase) / N-methyltransferase [Microbacterium humi]
MIDTALAVLLIAFIGLFGLAIGSFLNVVAYRVPLGLSVASPPSACPGCDSPIRSRDNIPVLSWLLLRGRCRTCREPISAQYPLVEAASGIFFVAVAAWFMPRIAAAETLWPHGVAASLALVAFLYLAAISIPLTLIDLRTQKLPNRIVRPAYLVAGALLLTASALTGDWAGALRTLAGAVILFVLYLVLALVYPGGMGFGDVKLAGLLGLYLGYLGWGSLLVGGFAAFVVGGLVSLALIALRRANRKSGIPFGPWMLAGALIGALAGEPLFTAYLTMLGMA